MSKFRFYRVSLIDGEVTGTNDEALAREYAKSEDDFIIDTETGTWLPEDGESADIKETQKLPADTSADD